MGGAKLMWKYVKSLEYPINIKRKDLKMQLKKLIEDCRVKELTLR